MSVKAPVESRSVTRVMDVLDLFGKVHEELTLTEISRRLGVPKSSAHALLQAMRRRGYLAWNPATKGFSIGLRVLALSQAAPVLRMLQQRARPHMEALAVTLRETVMLGTFEAESVVCVDTVESPDPVRFTVQLGERRPLHCTSLGKLYLASLDDGEVRRILAHGLSRETPATITEVDELLEQLRTVRQSGYATNRAESIEGLYSVGVPIPPGSGMPVAGLSIVGVAERMAAKEEHIVRELRQAIARLSEELGAGLDMSTRETDPGQDRKE
ncbi:MAG TPA: IclR family transcriptional regulator [Gaiellaceae bacterium]|nr:IclR family transcriptional regulator [Gaiellaceae bacterium]